MKNKFKFKLILSVFVLALTKFHDRRKQDFRIKYKPIEMDFSLKTTWNGDNVAHDPVRLRLKVCEAKRSLEIFIEAPFFNKPSRPLQNPGDDFDLWNYEGLHKLNYKVSFERSFILFQVVEVFFLSDSGKYLELEFGPYVLNKFDDASISFDASV